MTLRIPACVNERNAEWSKTTVLCVALLEIAQTAHELLAGDVFVVGPEILLGGLAGVVDEDVGIGRHAGNGANHVAAIINQPIFSPSQSSPLPWKKRDVLVEDVELLGRCVLLEELRGNLALGGEDDAILG